MVLYLIGALFTFGVLIAYDNVTKKNDYEGFKGGMLLLSFVVIWPLSLGVSLVFICEGLGFGNKTD